MYDRPEADEWVQPVKRRYKLCCCDCGLVHEMDFRTLDRKTDKVTNHVVQFRVRRHPRATAGVRSWMTRRLNQFK